MTYKLNDIVEVKEQWYECASGKCVPFTKVKHFKVTDILFGGDIVLGRCDDEIKILYKAAPYVTCMNKPTYFININCNRR